MLTHVRVGGLEKGKKMKRPIESRQRKVRVLNFEVNAAGTAVTGPDALEVSVVDTGTGVKTVTLSEPFPTAAKYIIQCTVGTADAIANVVKTSASVFVVDTLDATDGTTAKDAIVYVTVIGTDVRG